MEGTEHELEVKSRQTRLEKTRTRLLTIDKIVTKLYTDNAEGRIDDDRLRRMVAELEKESTGLTVAVTDLSQDFPADNAEESFKKFFALAKRFMYIDVLDRDTLLTFVERIEVGPKQLPEGIEKASHHNTPYVQSIRIFYKFIGELTAEPIRDLPKVANI